MTCPVLTGATDQLCIYLRTASHCQLNCKHCFTDGSAAPKEFFDPDATIEFFKKLHAWNPKFQYGFIAFHGGEPFLAPAKDMIKVWHECKDLWPGLQWSIQTNLTMKITPEKHFILETVCDKAWGTSWDKDIRWNGDIMKEQLWERNVRYYAEQGHQITVMVSITKNIVDSDPKQIIEYLHGLGIQHINFERVTPDGNALLNQSVFATNAEVDAWIAKMWDQTLEHKLYERVHNMFFDSILTSAVYNTFAGCRCRECEQKILTINADGSVGGCPNSATNNVFGDIAQPIEELWFSQGRMKNIQQEILRNPECYGCPVFDLCNGDCHQLAWEGNVCAAPKTLMKRLKQDNDIDLYREILGDFVGQE